MYNLIIELVRLGFHGVAVVMLILGYRLLRGVLEKQSKITSEIGLSGLKLRLKEVRVFLVISLVFFILGAGSELFRRSQEKQQENEMTVLIQPEISTIQDKKFVPILRKDTTDSPGPILLSINKETSTFSVKVRHGQKLYVQFHKLTQELERLRYMLNLKMGEKEKGGIDDGI